MLPDGRLPTISITFAILFIRSITPMCMIYTILWLLDVLPNPALDGLGLHLQVITIPETLFYFLVYLPRRYVLREPAKEGTTMSRDDRQQLAGRLLENVSDMSYFIRTWFRGAPIEEIKRDDVREWLAWGLWNRYSTTSNQVDSEELDEYLARVEKKLGRTFEEGSGPHRPVRITVDRVDIQHRPLVWYVFGVGVVDMILFYKMWRLGFQHFPLYGMFKSFPFRPLSSLCKQYSPARDISYWYRPHTSKKHLPILYIHGIGIGLTTYTSFFADFMEKNRTSDPKDQMGIIAIELMPISFRVTSPVLHRLELIKQITQILRHHGWLSNEHQQDKQFMLAANSYGTIVATFLLNDNILSPSIGPVILIDPITVWVHMGDVAYNFTAKTPKSASERELHYFARTDIGVAHTVTRRFIWTDNVLWKYELAGRKFVMVLSGKDIIFDAERCKRHLLSGRDEIERSSIGDVRGAEVIKTGDLEILWFKALNHAEVFENQKKRGVLVAAIWRCLLRS